MPVTTLEQTVDPTGALSSLDLAQQDISNIIDQFNQLQNQLNGGNITQNQQNIIVFDNTTNRVLIGYQAILNAWGLFVSQPGIDVTQATTDQLIFNSNQNVFKIIKIVPIELSFVLNTDGTVSFGEATLAHGLNFTPAYVAFITIDSVLADLSIAGVTNGPNPFLIFGDAPTDTLKPELFAQVLVDATTVYFSIQTTASGGATVNNSAVVYLLQESAVSS